jgi:hypothetical protein
MPGGALPQFALHLGDKETCRERAGCSVTSA